nr:hypothetical protein [Pseudomonas aeruginosa]
MLEKLADYNENRQKIRSKLIQSLIYPCMLTWWPILNGSSN